METMRKQHRKGATDAPESKRTEHAQELDQDDEQHSFSSQTTEQALMTKRLEEALNSHIKFVRPKQLMQDEELDVTNENPQDQLDDGIYLFADSKQRLSGKNLLEYENLRNGINNSKKHVIRELKKRKLPDDDESEDESTKLKSVAVSSDWVIKGKY